MNPRLVATAFASLAAFSGVAGGARASDALAMDQRGITYTSADGQLRLDLGGRVQFDSIAYNPGRGSFQAGRFRRARVELSGALGQQIEFKIEHEFVKPGGWRNLWIAFRPTRQLELKAGNFTAPFSMEDLQNSNTTTFMERSLMNALSPGYGLGVAASVHGAHWTASGGWFGNALRADDGHQRVRGQGESARVTYAPIDSKGDVLHIGAAFEHRVLGATELLRLQTWPEIAFTPIQVHSRGLSKAHEFNTLEFESGGTHGPLMFQTQFVEMQVSRTGEPRAYLQGAYVQGGWLITGQHYGYSRSSGVLTGIKLNGTKNALELSARYSYLNLNDTRADGGTGRDLTVGVNWYPTENFRVTGNYVRANWRNRRTSPELTANVFAVRLQAAF
jgi:phosphate-selective porin OprO/OprP